MNLKEAFYCLFNSLNFSFWTPGRGDSLGSCLSVYLFVISLVHLLPIFPGICVHFPPKIQHKSILKQKMMEVDFSEKFLFGLKCTKIAKSGLCLSYHKI